MNKKVSVAYFFQTPAKDSGGHKPRCVQRLDLAFNYRKSRVTTCSVERLVFPAVGTETMSYYSIKPCSKQVHLLHCRQH